MNTTPTRHRLAAGTATGMAITTGMARLSRYRVMPALGKSSSSMRRAV
jgi:hypothetical protein